MRDSVLLLSATVVDPKKVCHAEFGPARLGKLSPVLVAALLLCSAARLSAGTITISFEGLSDSTILTTQYPGVTFTNAIILTSGISLNEFEFPPHSGVNVVSDNGGPMSIDFASPVLSFSGYFTYAEALTLAAFGPLNNQVASVPSLFSNNEALSGVSGSSPNEFLRVNFASGISSVTITGDPAGGSFMLDDASYTTAVTGVPEPSSFPLCFTGLGVLFAVWGFRGKLNIRASLRAVLIVLVLYGARSAAFGQTVGTASADPTYVVVSTPTVITVTVSIPGSALIPNSVNLLRLGAPGSQPIVLGLLHDDGMNGDAVAGDHVFTIQVPFTEPSVGQITLQISAAFKGQLTRVRISVPTVFVQTANATDVVISTLSSYIQSGNITAAASLFADVTSAQSDLSSLDPAGRAGLASFFASASPVSSTSRLRLYSAPLTSNGQTQQVEFAMELTGTGQWVVVGW